ncbi:MAG: oligosaccharide flippase family protein [Anaerolineae bacterium]|nr:oligosaccharide flippase family protein [Anaerolineae bacterium]
MLNINLNILSFEVSLTIKKLLQIDRYWQGVKNNKLVTNAGLYISGNVVQKAFAFLLIPLWARFLTPEDYGITGTLTVYGGVLYTLLLMGLQGSATRHYYDYLDDITEQKSYVTSVVIFQMALPGVVVVALNIWGPALWSGYIGSTIPFDPYVRLMLWATYTLSLTQIPISLYQAQQKAREFVYIQYGKFGLDVVATVILVVILGLRAYGMMLSQLTVSLITALIVLYLFRKNWFTWRFKWAYVRMSLVFGLPLVPHAIFGQILLAADRFIMDGFVSLAEIGLYNVGYMMGMSMLVLVGGINQAWVPYYYNLMQTELQPGPKIIKVVSIYVVLTGGICLLGVLFIGEAVYILMPPTYYHAVFYVPPILFGYLLIGFYYLAVSPLFYYGKTTIIPFLTGLAAGLNIVFNLWLIPRYGAIAAAWTTTVTQGVLFFLVFFVGQKYQHLNYPLGKYGAVVLIVLTATLVTSRLGIFEGGALLMKFALVIAYGIIAYLVLIGPNIGGQKTSLS